MFRAAFIILTFVKLLLVEGGGTSSSVGNKTEIGSNSTKRVLYGQPTSPSEHPYLVKLHHPYTNNICGGSIISNHWVLTAAHCLRIGNCNAQVIHPAAWPYAQGVSPLQCYLHEKSRLGQYEYDIGLIKTSQDLLQDRRARAIGLPRPGVYYPVGTPILIVGWGRTEGNRDTSTPFKANVKLISWETCNRKYVNHHWPGVRDMPRRVECTQGDGYAPSGTCLGDSGGPAITPDGVVIGVAAFLLMENNFCMIGSPSMFTSVVDYLPWIYRIIDPSKDTSSFPVRAEHF